MKQFAPMLCPAEKVDLSTIKYPIYASTKLDGIRCIFHPTLGMVSRSLKPIPSMSLNQKFKFLLQYAMQYNVILDGELYSEGMSFQEITRAVMTEDIFDSKKLKEYEKEGRDAFTYAECLIDKIKFFVFDVLNDDLKQPFANRIIHFSTMHQKLSPTWVDDIQVVTQIIVNNQQEVLELFEENLQKGYEGLILKNPNGKYKFGRGTLKEGLCYKVKPFIEKSGIIKGFVQSTIVDENAEKTINELGRSVTSKKKDDRILIEKCSAFVIDYNGQDLKVTIAATDAEKEEIWKNQSEYIGKEVCYKSMEVGAKDLPRHPVAIRWWKHDE